MDSEEAGRRTAESEDEHELNVYEWEREEDDREDEEEKWRDLVGKLREAAQGIEDDKNEGGIWIGINKLKCNREDSERRSSSTCYDI